MTFEQFLLTGLMRDPRPPRARMLEHRPQQAQQSQDHPDLRAQQRQRQLSASGGEAVTASGEAEINDISLRKMSDEEFDSLCESLMNVSRHVDKERARRHRTKSLEHTIEVDENSPFRHFLCPITLGIMSDPVIAMDGSTYERAAIEKHIGGRATFRSPKTGTTVDASPLIPNNDLRSHIMQTIDRQCADV